MMAIPAASISEPAYFRPMPGSAPTVKPEMLTGFWDASQKPVNS